MDREMEMQVLMMDMEMPGVDLKVLNLLWQPPRLWPAARLLFWFALQFLAKLIPREVIVRLPVEMCHHMAGFQQNDPMFFFHLIVC